MSVPSYENLGKSARDVFKTGYAFDFAKFRVVGPKQAVGAEADASIDLKTYKAKYNILGKYNAEQYGEISTKYSSDGPLVGEYCLNSVFSENVDLKAGVSVNPVDSFQSIKLCAKFHNAILHSTCSITKDLDRNVEILGSTVLKVKNFFLGYRTGFDTNSSRVTKNDMALEIEHGDAALHMRCIQIPREFGLSAVYKVNDKVQVALDAKLANSEDDRLWYTGAGFMYKLDDQSKLRMKLDKNLQLGTSLQHRVQENLLLTLAFSLDLASPSTGQHKIGFGLDVEA